MLKSRKQKFVASVVRLNVAGALSATKNRFAQWLSESLSSPSIKRG